MQGKEKEREREPTTGNKKVGHRTLHAFRERLANRQATLVPSSFDCLLVVKYDFDK